MKIFSKKGLASATASQDQSAESQLSPLDIWQRIWRPGTPRLIFCAVILGIAGAMAAQIFNFCLDLGQRCLLTGLAGYKPPGLPNEGGSLQVIIGPHGLWLIPAVTALGGLLSGLLVYTLAPEAEGHGTDAAVTAFHVHKGYIRARVPPVKTIASAITIGSGGSAGKEGPTAQIAAGIGSLLGKLFRLDEHERRWMMLAGMAAGLSAVFRSPLGTAIFSVEVLYGTMELESRALAYTGIAAVVAYAINSTLVGPEPIFQLPPKLGAWAPHDLLFFALLGVVAGLVAALLPFVFYRIRDLFHRLPIYPHVKPAIGGLLLGLMALALPQVLGGGYGWMQMAIDQQLPALLLVCMALGKILALSLTIGSGGSGGVFAPCLYVGTMLGAAVATGLNHVMPQVSLDVHSFAIVGMAAFFAGAARVPLATMMMVLEMTGGYTLLVPALLAVLLSFLIEGLLTMKARYPSLYEAQVPTLADSPAHHSRFLQTAIKLLKSGSTNIPPDLTRLEVQDLLRLGIPIPLGVAAKTIYQGRIRPDATCVGKPIKECWFSPYKAQILAIIHSDVALIPGPETVLSRHDLVIVALSPENYPEVRQEMEVLTLEEKLPEPNRE
jgi:CIC family chloride channel protein